jgi:hypothetical protein
MRDGRELELPDVRYDAVEILTLSMRWEGLRLW